MNQALLSGIASKAYDKLLKATESKQPIAVTGLPDTMAAYIASKLCADTGKKVLLVEDNELNREIATAILEEAGLKVDAVEDGTDAVARMNEAAEDEYDLILMDIQMPKMDGYTATREIRTLSSNKRANIPIVAMTANAFEEDRQKAFKAGMNAHIAKPIDVNILMGTLDKVFKQNS